MDGGIHIDVVDKEDGEFRYLAVLDFDDVLFPQLRVARHEDLACLLVHHIPAHGLSQKGNHIDGDPVYPGGLDLFQGIAGHLPPLTGNDLTRFRVDDILIQPLLQKNLGIQPLVKAAFCDLNDLTFIKIGEDLFLAVPQGTQKDGHGKFTTPINSNIHVVFLVKFKIEPGPPIGNHPTGIDLLPTLTLRAEKDPGRPMKLADHHPLRSVDDKGAMVRHQGDLTEIDILLLDGLDHLFVFPLRIPDDETDHNLHGGLVGQSLHDTFHDIGLWLPNVIAHEIQGRRFIEIMDRKNGFKDLLKPSLLSLLGGNIHLEEIPIGFCLDLDQVSNFDDFPYLGEILANDFALH